MLELSGTVKKEYERLVPHFFEIKKNDFTKKMISYFRTAS